VADTGEKRRPPRLLAAFRALGIEVSELTGERRERARRLPEILRALPECDFVYSENSTLPLGLTSHRHLPCWPNPDSALFRAAGRAGVPAGVFYRDAYWRLPEFRRRIGWLKAALAIPFYRAELRLYRRCVTRLFVPSLAFADLFLGFPRDRVAALPPGGDVVNRPPPLGGDSLSLIYVGNVTPPLYDLEPLLETVAGLDADGVRLTVVTPAAAWERNAAWPRPPNLDVQHASGDALGPLYARADAAILAGPTVPYMRVNMPTKFFEAVGHGLPVIAYAGTECGRLVEGEGLGWSIAADGLASLLRRLRAQPDEVAAVAATVAAKRAAHTWEARARQVVRELAGRRRAAK